MFYESVVINVHEDSVLLWLS